MIALYLANHGYPQEIVVENVRSFFDKFVDLKSPISETLD